MKYVFQIDDKMAEVTWSDNLTKEELELVKDTISHMIQIRINRKKELEQNKLPITADIDSLYPELSGRTRNILKRNNCNTIGDVLDCTLTDIKNMRNMGKKSFEEIKERFGAYGRFTEEGVSE